jgi:hypothetical protein
MRPSNRMTTREWVAVTVMAALIPVLLPLSEVAASAPVVLPGFTILIISIAGRRPFVYGLVSMNILCLSYTIYGVAKAGIGNIAGYEWLLAVPSFALVSLIALAIAWPFHLAQKRQEVGP